MIDRQELAQLCEKNGFRLADGTRDKLAAYLETLFKWNRVMNLVGPDDWREILQDLVLDSFHLAGFIDTLPLPPEPICWDFGAGAGMPGIPLRMVWTRGEYTMVEAREKRAVFLQAALASCKLDRTFIHRGRAERFMTQSLNDGKPADLLVSRAFMPWRAVLDFARGKLAPGGLAVCLTLDPQPESVPANWSLLQCAEYAPRVDMNGGKRYFWAFAQA